MVAAAVTETPVRTLDELVAVVGQPNEVAAHKVQDRLHDLHRQWLEASPFCVLDEVDAPLVGIIGATQAAEALKLVARAGTSLAGRLLMLDALSMEWREVRVPRDPACSVCAGRDSESTPG